MRRLISFLLVLCCLFSLTACIQEEEIPEDSVAVFYKRAEITYGAQDSVIAQAYLRVPGRTDDVEYILRKYLVNPPGEDFVFPFPENLSLVSYKLEGLTAKVVLSDEMAILTGMELTIALTCLTHTVISLTDCREVIISANTALLDGQHFITLTKDSYLMTDDSGDTE